MAHVVEAQLHRPVSARRIPSGRDEPTIRGELIPLDLDLFLSDDWIRVLKIELDRLTKRIQEFVLCVPRGEAARQLDDTPQYWPVS
jgi:hypothetical protein